MNNFFLSFRDSHESCRYSLDSAAAAMSDSADAPPLPSQRPHTLDQENTHSLQLNAWSTAGACGPACREKRQRSTGALGSLLDVGRGFGRTRGMRAGGTQAHLAEAVLLALNSARVAHQEALSLERRPVVDVNVAESARDPQAGSLGLACGRAERSQATRWSGRKPSETQGEPACTQSSDSVRCEEVR